ncbi:MAG: RNA polymerase sigma factor RpoE [Pontibacterium sp.]
MSQDVEALVDRQLVERVQAGDFRAFDLLVKKYQSRVIALISRYVTDQSEALDVSQEAFIKAYKALPSFRGDSSFYTWLYRIAINAAKNHLVAMGRRPPAADVLIDDAYLTQAENGLDEVETPENQLNRDEMHEALVKVMEGLSDDLRIALSLREFEGMSYEEISEVMGCPVGTVRSRIFRAREAIDAELRPFLIN